MEIPCDLWQAVNPFSFSQIHILASKDHHSFCQPEHTLQEYHTRSFAWLTKNVDQTPLLCSMQTDHLKHHMEKHLGFHLIFYHQLIVHGSQCHGRNTCPGGLRVQEGLQPFGHLFSIRHLVFQTCDSMNNLTKSHQAYGITC